MQYVVNPLVQFYCKVFCEKFEFPLDENYVYISHIGTAKELDPEHFDSNSLGRSVIVDLDPKANLSHVFLHVFFFLNGETRLVIDRNSMGIRNWKEFDEIVQDEKGVLYNL